MKWKILKYGDYFGWYLNDSYSSVAKIGYNVAYQEDDPFFTITCTFIGTETPSSITWSRETDSKSEEIREHSNFSTRLEEKEAVLNKTRPVVEDGGNYTCRFGMGIRTDREPSAEIEIQGPRQYRDGSCLTYSFL